MLTRKSGAGGTASCLATAPRARPRSASPSQRAVDPRRTVEHHGRHRHPSRIELWCGTPHRVHRLHRAFQRERPAGPVSASRGASCRRAPRRDASREGERTQLVKEHPRITSTSARWCDPGGRDRGVSGALHGAPLASVALPREVPAFSTVTALVSTTSDAPEVRALPCLATDDSAPSLDPASTRSTRERPGAPRGPERLLPTAGAKAPGAKPPVRVPALRRSFTRAKDCSRSG